MKKNLVHIRADFGFSQKQLAKLTGVSQPTISQIEQGKTYPQAITRHKIEQVLGPVNWIGTKLHGGHQIEPSDNESPESRVIREIEMFVADDQIKGYEFLADYIGRKLFKVRLIEKAYKHLDGQKQKFTAEELDVIHKCAAANSGVYMPPGF